MYEPTELSNELVELSKEPSKEPKKWVWAFYKMGHSSVYGYGYIEDRWFYDLHGFKKNTESKYFGIYEEFASEAEMLRAKEAKDAEIHRIKEEYMEMLRAKENTNV